MGKDFAAAARCETDRLRNFINQYRREEENAHLDEIPEIKCPECETPMEYQGGPSDSNIFIMRCPKCGYSGTYYPGDPRPKKPQTGSLAS